MAEDKKIGSGGLTSAFPVTVVLAMLASLVFTHYLPYQDERPTNRPIQAKYQAAQDVDARLWQDPFAAVEGANDETQNPTQPSHGPNQIYYGNNLVVGDNITVIAVTLPGGPYQEAAEHRMRRRYAVLSGLANQNYTPNDEQHIGYFHPKGNKGLQKKVAFEWWSANSGDKKVLLLWVDESSLLGLPAEKLNTLLGQISHEIPVFQYAVIGPNTSTLLRDMLKEFGANKNNVTQYPNGQCVDVTLPALKGINGQPRQYYRELKEFWRLTYPLKPIKKILLYSEALCLSQSTMLREMDILLAHTLSNNKSITAECPVMQSLNTLYSTLGEINGQPIIYYAAGATASDQRLLGDVFESKEICGTVSEYLLRQNVELHRITPTDRGMMDVLVAELGLRQVEKSDHVLILSEWDSFYGRAMPKAFKNAWSKDDKEREVVQVFGYMRGLDGKLPDKGDKAAVADKKPDSKDKSEVAASIESPEGQSQKDYLRRLADHIVELDQDFKNQGHDKGVAAIGVLGSDVHDKLMILEALRQYFPHKLFFTTDLDAAYNHPSKRRQTHNLLVASAFDLKLRSGLQGNIPPFRDTYQTAMFLAAQLAVNTNKVSPEKIELQPRLFEIGRNHPIPLPTRKENLLLLPNDDKEKCSWEAAGWQDCKNAVYSEDFAAPQFNWAWKPLGLGIWLIVFLYFISSWFRQCLKNVCGYVNLHRPHTIVVGLISLFISYVVVKRWNGYIIGLDAEPFYWFEGVSIWPSQLLRFLIVPVAATFFYWGNLRIKKMQSELQEQAGTGEIPKTFSILTTPDQLGYWEVLFVGNWKKKSPNSPCVVPENLWGKYLGFLGLNMAGGWLPGWLWRVIVHFIVFVLTAGLLIFLGGVPNIPARSSFAMYVNKALIIAAVFFTLFLTIWVVENARLCERLIDELSDKPSRWHQNAKAWAIVKNKVAMECVDEWLDIQLVTKLTATMQPLIFGPVVCIALLVAARSPVIDDWDIPRGLEIVLASLLFYSILAEVFLQRGAKSARKKAIDLLSNKISVQRNLDEPNDVVIKRIEAEIERIKDLREGAFRPWYEWPLLQSFGGFGSLWVALQYFAGVWGEGSL